MTARPTPTHSIDERQPARTASPAPIPEPPRHVAWRRRSALLRLGA